LGRGSNGIYARFDPTLMIADKVAKVLWIVGRQRSDLLIRLSRLGGSETGLLASEGSDARGEGPAQVIVVDDRRFEMYQTLRVPLHENWTTYPSSIFTPTVGCFELIVEESGIRRSGIVYEAR